MHITFIAGNARSLVANRGDLIADMKRAGHRVSAAVPSEDYLDSVEGLGIEVHKFALGRTGMNPVRDLLTLFRLFLLLRRLRPDMTFSYTIKPVVFGNLAAMLAGVPRRYAMITGLGTTFGEPKTSKAALLRRVVVYLYRLGISASTRVFFQNPDDLQDFLDLGVMSDRSKAVRTMGSGVNMARFPREPLPQGAPVFLLIARLLTEKGVCEFVDAARMLRASHPQAQFVVVGPHDPELPHSVPLELVERWKAEGLVRFVGGVSDVRPWLRECSVFVLPSYYREGTPRSVLEAMCTGRAVVTTDSPGCRETVVDGQNGFLVPPRDAAALAARMGRFLEEPELVQRMGEASFERIVSDYDVRKVNEVILKSMGLS